MYVTQEVQNTSSTRSCVNASRHCSLQPPQDHSKRSAGLASSTVLSSPPKKTWIPARTTYAPLLGAEVQSWKHTTNLRIKQIIIIIILIITICFRGSEQKATKKTWYQNGLIPKRKIKAASFTWFSACRKMSCHARGAHSLEEKVHPAHLTSSEKRPCLARPPETSRTGEPDSLNTSVRWTPERAE